MSETEGGLKVFAGSSHAALAREICDCLGIPLGQAHTVRSPTRT